MLSVRSSLKTNISGSQFQLNAPKLDYSISIRWVGQLGQYGAALLIDVSKFFFLQKYTVLEIFDIFIYLNIRERIFFAKYYINSQHRKAFLSLIKSLICLYANPGAGYISVKFTLTIYGFSNLGLHQSVRRVCAGFQPVIHIIYKENDDKTSVMLNLKVLKHQI